MNLRIDKVKLLTHAREALLSVYVQVVSEGLRAGLLAQILAPCSHGSGLHLAGRLAGKELGWHLSNRYAQGFGKSNRAGKTALHDKQDSPPLGVCQNSL